MEIRAVRSLLTAAVIIALGGCATPLAVKTYEGQQLPVTELAVLNVDTNIYVSEIAGHQTGVTLGDRSQIPNPGMQFEVKPGPQKIRFQYFATTTISSTVGNQSKLVSTTRSSAASAPIVIVHEFKKGHKYEVHYKPGGEKFEADIVDVTTTGARLAQHIGWGETYVAPRFF